jgi:hypothetical protein
LLGVAVLAAGSASPALAHPAAVSPAAKPPLHKASSDPYSGDGAQHATEAEPDTMSAGKTVVSVFQVGRYGDGGSSNTGWATSLNKGKTWHHGFLPGITVAEGGPYQRASDPVVAYDAKHGVWLVTSLVINSGALGVVVNRSTDGLHWDDPILAVGGDGKGYDKEWIVCDSTPSSPHYGNCYIEVDVTSSGNLITMSTSKNGGKTWGPQTFPSGSPSGLGGQPLVQPDGTVVVPYSANFSSQNAFRSTDGGDSWSSPVLISNISDHEVPGMREEPLPTAEMDATGTIYVAWDDCRFRTGCTSNDIVMSTSKNGVDWSDVVRIPIDSVHSGRDHFDPGLGVSHTTSGKHALMGLYYYFYPDASCAIADCKLDVGYVSSDDGGRHWSDPTTVAGPMKLAWLAQAGGAMIGDYLSCSVIGSTATSVFAVGKAPTGSTKNQAMYSSGPLPITGGKNLVGSAAVHPSSSDGRPTLPVIR